MILVEKLLFKNVLNFGEFMYGFISRTCKYINFICRHIVKFFIEDFATDRINYEKLFENFHFSPGGTSARNVNHWVQLYNSKKFTQFDYGRDMNFLKYGQHHPPHYDISTFSDYKIKSFMTLSNADPFSKIEDCEHILNLINKKYLTIKYLHNYNHLDYLWSSNAKQDLYFDIINFLKDG